MNEDKSGREYPHEFQGGILAFIRRAVNRTSNLKIILNRNLGIIVTSGSTLIIRSIGAGLLIVQNLFLAKLMPLPEMGIYVLIIPALTILSFGMSLGLAPAALRFVTEYRLNNQPGHARGYLIVGLCSGGAVALTAAAGIVVLRALLSATYFPYLNPTVSAAAGLLLIPLTAHNFLIEYQRALGRPAQSLLLQSILNPIATMVIVYTLHLSGKLTAGSALWGTALFAWFLLALQGIILWWRDGAWLSQGKTSRDTRQWLSVGKPLIAQALASNIAVWLDLFLVGLLGTAEMAAIYAIMHRLLYFCIFSSSTIAYALAPKLAEMYFSPDRSFSSPAMVRLSVFTITPTFLVVPAILVFAKPILLFFGPAFLEVVIPLSIVVIAYLFRSLFGPNEIILTIAGREKLAAKLSILSAFALAALCILLVPKYGLIGAAISSAVTQFITALIAFTIVRGTLHLDLSIVAFLRQTFTMGSNGQKKT